MIYRVSDRTDVPGCYWEWFLRRLEAGYCLVRNPKWPEKVSSYALTPDVCDGFTFISKNYGPALRGVDGLMSLPEIIERYRIVTFDMTFTPYPQMERGIPDVVTRYRDLKALSSLAGRERLRWFLAPVLIIDGIYDVAYNKHNIETLVRKIAPYVSSCMLDEVNVYSHVERRGVGIRRMSESERDEVFGHVGEVAAQEGLLITCCPHRVGILGKYGVVGRECASREGYLESCGAKVVRGPKMACGCVASRDLGAYAPCAHMCAYCYAHPGAVRDYDPISEMLCDHLRGNEIVTEAKAQSLCA